MAVTVSAPGKLILMGEHAVVYGRPALVAAVDLRLFARFSPAAPGRPGALRIELPGLHTGCDVTWPEVRTYARQARERWEGYAAQPGPEAFRALRGADPIHLVKVALGEAAAASPLDGDAEPPFDLRVDSHLPIGSGMGSSAAAAVAVVAGYRLWRSSGIAGRADIDLPEIERLAHEVERRQHGTPSGVDAATVARGGLLWARRRSGGAEGLAIEPLAARSPLLRRIAVYDTGSPAEATGAVVAAVRERAGRAPRRHERILDRLEEATLGLRAELAAESFDPRRVVELLRAGEAGLEELGAVPEAVRERVRQVEAAGGAAKISGAGALTGLAAGILLAYHPEPDFLATLSALALPQYPVHLGAAGLRREET